jgi:hypothetical protein
MSGSVLGYDGDGGIMSGIIAPEAVSAPPAVTLTFHAFSTEPGHHEVTLWACNSSTCADGKRLLGRYSETPPSSIRDTGVLLIQWEPRSAINGTASSWSANCQWTSSAPDSDGPYFGWDSPLLLVRFKGRDAALDGWSPLDPSADGCQLGRLPLPEGWSLAPADNDSLAVARSFPWGTSFVILSNGSRHRLAAPHQLVHRVSHGRRPGRQRLGWLR